MPKTTKNKKKVVREDKTARVVEVLIEEHTTHRVSMRVPDDTTEAELEEICRLVPTGLLRSLKCDVPDWSQSLVKVEFDEYLPVVGNEYYPVAYSLKLERDGRRWWMKFHDSIKHEMAAKLL